MSVTTGQPARSVTATARRAQIVAATIEVIADVGYAQTSFARIADHASLSSTRLISYHFAGKDDLMAAVAEDVIGSISDYMSARLSVVMTPTAMLSTYLEGTIGFIASHRPQMQALTAIFLAGALKYDAGDDQVVTSHVEDVLRKGQETGEFRDFDARVMASVIQRAVDGLPFLLESTPGLDCAAYARELVTLFELGTRRSTS